MKFSKDGSLLGLAIAQSRIVELYNFNIFTGALTLRSTINTTGGPGNIYGFEFSPNGQYAYFGDGYTNYSTNSASIYQINVAAGTYTAIPNTTTSGYQYTYGDMQLAPNNKIYVIDRKNQARPYLLVMNIPDNSDPGIFNGSTLNTEPVSGTTTFGLPTVVSASPGSGIHVTATNATICPGETAVLTASGAKTYVWVNRSNGQTYTGSSITVQPTVTTTYFVTGTDEYGCTQSVNSVVTVYTTTWSAADSYIGWYEDNPSKGNNAIVEYKSTGFPINFIDELTTNQEAMTLPRGSTGTLAYVTIPGASVFKMESFNSTNLQQAQINSHYLTATITLKPNSPRIYLNQIDFGFRNNGGSSGGAAMNISIEEVIPFCFSCPANPIFVLTNTVQVSSHPVAYTLDHASLTPYIMNPGKTYIIKFYFYNLQTPSQPLYWDNPGFSFAIGKCNSPGGMRYASATTETTGGINNVAKNESAILVYPNPSNGIFTIETGTSSKTVLEVYNILGKKIVASEINNTYKLDLSGYPKGIYSVNIITNGESVSKKIILE